MLGIFLDTETNGLNYTHNRIIDIAFKVLDVLDGKLIKEYQTIVKQNAEIWKLSNPESLKINGFSYEMVQQGKEEAEVANEIKVLFQEFGITRGEAVFICQNPSFDRVFFSQLIDADTQEELMWPYHWLDLASMFWAVALHNQEGPLPWQSGLSKDKIATHFGLEKEGTPHRAISGVNHLIACYEATVGFIKKP